MKFVSAHYIYTEPSWWTTNCKPVTRKTRSLPKSSSYTIQYTACVKPHLPL